MWKLEKYNDWLYSNWKNMKCGSLKISIMWYEDVCQMEKCVNCTCDIGILWYIVMW